MGLHRVGKVAAKLGKVGRRDPASPMDRIQLGARVNNRPIERRCDELVLHVLQPLDRDARKERGKIGIIKNPPVHLGYDFGHTIGTSESIEKDFTWIGHMVLFQLNQGV